VFVQHGQILIYDGSKDAMSQNDVPLGQWYGMV